MASNDLAIKFSNEVYATKKEVSEYMKTPMIDSIWNSVLEYRSNFSMLTKLRHITDANYSICLTPTLNEKVNAAERKMLRLYSKYIRLLVNKNEYSYKKLAYKSVLESVATHYNLVLDEVSLNRILNKNVQSLSPELMIIYHYYLTLEKLEKDYISDINLNTFKGYLSTIQGSEVTEFRKSEITNSLSKVLINKLYLGIPTTSIDKSMNDLVAFLNDDNVGMLVKASCALYYVYYVKPMETYSEEIAILTFKNVLANAGLDDLGATLPFEILLDDKEELEKHIIEAQKSLDLTYVLNYVLSKINGIIDEVNKYLSIAETSEVRHEMFQEDKDISSEMPDLSSLEAEIEVKMDDKSPNPINFSKSVAIENVPTGLNEVEAKRLEEHLKEMNPNLSHAQAYFYARHCTVGMAYTISQYKKEVGCAYETARVAMDNLVFLGYYRKELLKNKFIYKPVKKN